MLSASVGKAFPPVPRYSIARARDFHRFFRREPPRCWYGIVTEGDMRVVCLGLDLDTQLMARWLYLYTPTARLA